MPKGLFNWDSGQAPPESEVPETTAENDVIVGDGLGTWIKKTLAQFKTILGLGTAAYTASTDYAPAAKGVTNGDSHNHSGGDGAQIDHGGLAGLSDDDHPQYVHDTGNETVEGIKTFGSFPVTPSAAPTANYEVANKKYVDDNAGGTSVTLGDVNVYTADDTWSKPAGLHHVIVEVVGGGGGGGTAPTTTSGAAYQSAGSGGGGGGYSKKKILAAALGATETVTVGEGGAAGNAGETSSFGAHATASGGAAGGALASSNLVGAGAGGAGGVGASGDINANGDAGGHCMRVVGNPFGGSGGGTVLGGMVKSNVVTSAGVAGTNGLAYGGGGSGGANMGSQASTRAGGAGAAGVVIVYNYISG